VSDDMENKYEQLLVTKNYYKAMTEESELLDLLKRFSLELSQKTEVENEDEIRFSQGELYFLIGDYEAAIFKWENVRKAPFDQWKLLNIGDAYKRLGDFKKAESSYHGIKDATLLLKKESLLSLFYLYHEEHLMDKAKETIQTLVALDWTYQNAYSVAVSFFEEIRDYDSAIDLIVTKLEEHYDETIINKILSYINGANEHIVSAKVTGRLINFLWAHDQLNLKQIFKGLNKHYKKWNHTVDWMNQIHQIMNESDPLIGAFILNEMPECYIQNINELFSGKYNLNELKPIVEFQFPYYFTIYTNPLLKRAFSFLQKAWNHYFPNNTIVVQESAVNFNSSEDQIYFLSDVRDLYFNISEWMKKMDVETEAFSSWWIDYYLDTSKKKVMVLGSFGNGKSSFINSFIGRDLLNADFLPTTSAVTVLEYGETEQSFEIQQATISTISIALLKNKSLINHEKEGQLVSDLFSIHMTLKVLDQHQITLIDTPGYNDQSNNHNPTLDYLPLADELLFILNAETPYKKSEKEIIQQIIAINPNINISFLLNKVDYLDEDELEEVIEDVSRKITKTFGRERLIIPYSSSDLSLNNQEVLDSFLNERSYLNLEQDRVNKVLPYFDIFLDKLEDQFNQKSVNLNNQLISKRRKVEELDRLKLAVQGYKNNLKVETIRDYTYFYNTIVDYVHDLTVDKLNSYSNQITMNSDLLKVHQMIDEAVNKDLKEMLRNTIVPQIIHLFSNWLSKIKLIRNTLEQDIRTLTGIDQVIKTENSVESKLALIRWWNQFITQFQRLGNSIEYRDIDTFKKVNPVQTILQGVGKIIGGKHHPSALRIENYRNQLETKLFKDVTKQYINQITRALSTYEQTIRDNFEQLFKETELYIENQKRETTNQMFDVVHALNDLNTSKIDYHDKLNLFRVKVAQLKYDSEKTNPDKVIV
jgi:GTP-binding protein EngB required for normal cell division